MNLSSQDISTVPWPRSHYARGISKRSFLSTVRPTVHNNPSRKRNFTETLFKPEGFENAWGPFLERPGKLTGPVFYFEIKVSRKLGCVLASNEVHFVSLAENFTV